MGRFHGYRHPIAARLFGAFLGLCVASRSAQAEPFPLPDAAGPRRDLAAEGRKLWEAGDYLGAADRFDRAYITERTPELGLWAARGFARAGRLLEAVERLRELVEFARRDATSSSANEILRVASAERQALLLRIPTLSIIIEGKKPGEVSLSLNGQQIPESSLEIPVPVDPGLSRLVGVYEARRVEASVRLAEGEKRTVRLSFEALPSAPVGALTPPKIEPVPVQPSRERDPYTGRRLAAYFSMGVGGAALLTGAAFGWMALADQADLEARCPRLRCASSAGPDVDTYESKKVIATVGLVSGAALVTAGALLYVTLPAARAERPARIGAFFGPRAAAVWGTF